MATYRERREARADRLEGWADKREQRGEATVARAREMGAGIPFGQPVLLGHYSAGRDMRYRERIGSTYDRGFEDLRKADEMGRKAESIRAAAARSVYSDDADAIERLTERIAGLEAERERVKAYNASARKGAPDVSLLDDRQREALESCRRHQPGYLERRKGQMPSYVLSNLSGNITKQRQRLEQLQAAADRAVQS